MTRYCSAASQRSSPAKHGQIDWSICMILTIPLSTLCSKVTPLSLATRMDLSYMKRSNFLIELPQPSSAAREVARPDSCIVYAHADGWFYNRNAEGRPRIMCRRNGVSLVQYLLSPLPHPQQRLIVRLTGQISFGSCSTQGQGRARRESLEDSQTACGVIVAGYGKPVATSLMDRSVDYS